MAKSLQRQLKVSWMERRCEKASMVVPHVYVLMAVFNGERYLNQQLSSIFQQSGVVVKLLVADDGSTDRSLEILREWQAKEFDMHIELLGRIGSSKVFATLLQMVPHDSIVAFSDQDDIWRNDKLYLQISKLDSEKPTLVISRRNYIDENGGNIGVSPNLRKPASWNNAFIENIAYGNTILLNSNGLELLRSKPIPQDVYFDSWIYCVFSSMGEVITIAEPLVDYRLHENNQIGIRRSNLRLNRVRNSIKRFDVQNKRLIDIYLELLPIEIVAEAQKFSEAFQTKSLILRCIRVFSLKVYRQSKFDHFIFRLIVPLTTRIKNLN
jgi:glycosyltransferase involved in cell wall biosynthesis